MRKASRIDERAKACELASARRHGVADQRTAGKSKSVKTDSSCSLGDAGAWGKSPRPAGLAGRLTARPACASPGSATSRDEGAHRKALAWRGRDPAKAKWSRDSQPASSPRAQRIQFHCLVGAIASEKSCCAENSPRNSFADSVIQRRYGGVARVVRTHRNALRSSRDLSHSCTAVRRYRMVRPITVRGGPMRCRCQRSNVRLEMPRSRLNSGASMYSPRIDPAGVIAP